MLTWTEFTCSKTCESLSAYNFAILPVFLLDAWGTFKTSMSEAEATRQHQTSSARLLSQVHARHALKSHCSERMWFRGLCPTGWRSPPACGSGQPYSSPRCVSVAGRSHAVPSKLSFPQLHFEVLDQAAPRSTLCSRCQGQVPASSPAQPSPFWLCPSFWMPTEPPFPHAKLVPCAFTSPEQTIWNEGAVLQ